jgi:hypothetical protein
MAVVALLAALTTASQGQADPGPNSEIFTGLEATDNAMSGYLGAGYAFGKGLYESGWRLRAVGSLGAYDYQGTIFGEGPTTFDGRASFGAAMLGYQLRAETLFLNRRRGRGSGHQSARSGQRRARHSRRRAVRGRGLV